MATVVTRRVGAAVITDQVAWPLTIWIAATLGPLTAIERRHRRNETTHTNGAST